MQTPEGLVDVCDRRRRCSDEELVIVSTDGLVEGCELGGCDVGVVVWIKVGRLLTPRKLYHLNRRFCKDIRCIWQRQGAVDQAALYTACLGQGAVPNILKPLETRDRH